MVSPHLLQPFSARQLSLVAGNDRVMVFSILGGRWLGPTALAHAPTLGRRTAELPGDIEVVAFIDEPIPEPATVSMLDDMISELRADGIARRVAVTEAIKRVVDDRVGESVDRSALSLIRCPEVIRKPALEKAIGSIGARMWVNPSALVVEAGGSVELIEAPTSQHVS